MKTATAWAPGNISLLFKVMPNPDPAKMGSLGSGFTVNEGATVTAVSGSDITFNGDPITLPTITHVTRALTHVPLSIAITSSLPLGSGFGMSGAAALATAYATKKLLSLDKTELELAKIAHTAEVVHKTGLGDVGNQIHGGCCVKFVTSSLFQMERLPFAGTAVYVKSWGKIPTPTILSNTTLVKKLDGVGEAALLQIKKRMKDPSFSFIDLINISNIFTKNSGLITYAPHAQKIIQNIQKAGGHAAMIILGDAVVSTIPFEGATKLTIVERGVSTKQEIHTAH